jgi:AcrR family transcriptional regulator/DNA-binding MarR family transcriptional regulator
VARGRVDAEIGAMPRRLGEPVRPVRPMRLRTDRNGHGFARDEVDEIQRARVLGALCEVVAERGLAGGTVAHIVARAGVSRRTFYELFADREECFLAAFDQAVQVAVERVVPAFRGTGRWRERVRAGLIALLVFLDEEPELGALCVVHALGAGPEALARRARVVRTLAGAVDEGRQEARRGLAPGPLTAEGVVGAVLAVLHTRLCQSASKPLTDLTGALMGMIVLPYLGSAAARRELELPVPRARTAARRGIREDPLQGLDMRLTYRTVRVLVAIAAKPGTSNRQIGDAAGIADQGQISKLLVRLEHLGLTQRDSGGRGEPNAWKLTPRGEQLQHTIQLRSSRQR